MNERMPADAPSAEGPVLSVRARAERTVGPDLCVLSGTAETRSPRKAEALAEAGRLQRRILEALAALGGVPARLDDERPALSWTTRRVSSYAEVAYDQATGQHEPTGLVVAEVGLELRVRDFDLLERVDAALAAVAAYNAQGAYWTVDPDNPAWRAVRTDAIAEALRQADDYAAALGCRVVRVEQVADAGLLDGGRVQAAAAPPGAMFRAASGPGGPPSLDPQPQQVSAAIDVRCATGPLPG